MSKTKLLIATHNKGKVKELQKFLSDLPVELVNLSDLNITQDVEEDKKTYKGNSQKKAKFYASLTNLPAIADDGGLEIAALNGEPGVKSRRWLGYDATDKELQAHMAKVAQRLPDDNRAAYFKLVLSFAIPGGKIWSTYGEVKGEIVRQPIGGAIEGLPFRAYFYLPQIQKYYHEKNLSQEEIEQYNHRYKAIKKLKPVLQNALSLGK